MSTSTDGGTVSLGGFLTFLMAATALGWNIYRSTGTPSHLGNYDFGTPEAAYRSSLRMQLNRDWQAMLEYEMATSKFHTQEKLDTLKIHKVSPWKDNKIMFVTYHDRGSKRHVTLAFEYDQLSKIWKQTPLNRSEIGDETLKLEMKNWTD